MAQEFIITRGIPGSGKSTWAQQWVAEDPENRVRVNRDELRKELYGEWFIPDPNNPKKQHPKVEQKISETELRNINQALRLGKSVVSDNTHLSPKSVPWAQKIAANHHLTLKVKDFHIHPTEAVKRNQQREREVPEATIWDIYNRLGPGGEFLHIPGTHTPQPFKLPTGSTKQPAINFDMDGTLTNTTSIQKYVTGKRKNFHLFHYHSLHCPPNDAVVEMLQDAQKHGFKILITTAREEQFREITDLWLKNHGIEYENMFMRKKGDNRGDYEIKKEMFTEITQHYDLVRACDDNPAAIRAWRENNLTVTQVPSTLNTPNLPQKIIIKNPFRQGVCLRCSRPLKNGGVIGPKCATKTRQ